MYKLGYDKMSASTWKLHQRVKGLGVKPAPGTDWRWLGKQMNTGGTLRPGGLKTPRVKSLQDIGGGTPRFRAAAKQTPKIEVGEIRQGKGAPHVVRGGQLAVPLGSGIAMYGRQQGKSMLRAGQLAQQRANRQKMTTHSHPTQLVTPEITRLKQKEIGDTARALRNVDDISEPWRATREQGLADRIEAAGKRNINIAPSGGDMMQYRQNPGWHGIVDPTSGETLHMRMGEGQKPRAIQSFQAMPESGMQIHPPFEAMTNPTFSQAHNEIKAMFDKELRKGKGIGRSWNPMRRPN